MLKENLVMLRNIHGYSQEQIAEKIGISRQAYAKWEKGTTVPDIEKCKLLAVMVPPAPRGKNIWGSVTINDRGQIVIPKDARDRFGLTGGQRLIVASDEVGIALIPDVTFEENMRKIMEMIYAKADKSE